MHEKQNTNLYPQLQKHFMPQTAAGRHAKRFNNQKYSILPRVLIKPAIFWPFFCVFMLAAAAGIFTYIDRSIHHNSLPQFLPYDTDLLVMASAKTTSRNMRLYQNLKNILPAGDQLLRAEFESFLASNADYAIYLNFWLNYRDQLEDEVVFAQDDKNTVMKASFLHNEVFDKENIQNEQNFMGETLFLLKNEENSAAAVWQRKQDLYISTDEKYLKQMIKLRNSQLLSKTENWFKSSNNLTLAENPRFQSAMDAYSDHTLIGFYVDPQSNHSLPGLVVDDSNILSQISLYIPALADFSKLETSNRSQFYYRSLEVYGDRFSVVGLSKDEVVDKDGLNMATQIPERLGDKYMQFYLQLDDVGSRIKQAAQNLEEDSGAYSSNQVLRLLQNRLGINLNIELLDLLNQRFAVVYYGGSAGKESATLFILEMDSSKNNNDQLKALDILKGAGIDLNARTAGNLIFLGVNEKDVESLSASFAKTKQTLSKKIDVNKESKIFAYLNSSILQTQGELLLPELKNNPEMIQFFEILSQSIPNVYWQAGYFKGDALKTNLTFSVQEVPSYKKQMFEKIAARFSNISNPQDALSQASVRDSSRLADLLILQDALKSYIQAEQRAPVKIEQLIPNYLQELPRDPKDSSLYLYNNSGGNSSFYLLVNMEGQTGLGSAGIYCLTSIGVFRGVDNQCFEQ